MIEEAIFDILSNDSNVGSIFGNRIRPNFTGQNDGQPYIIYEVDSLEPTPTKDAYNLVDYVEVNIRVFSKQHKDIRDGGQYVRDALEFFKGSKQGTNINRCKITNQQDRYDDEGELHIREQTFEFRLDN